MMDNKQNLYLKFISSRIFKNKNYDFDILIDQNNSINIDNSDTQIFIENYQLFDYYNEIYDILDSYLYHDIINIIINDYIGYNISTNNNKNKQYCKICCCCLYEIFIICFFMFTFLLVLYVVIMSFICILMLINLLINTF